MARLSKKLGPLGLQVPGSANPWREPRRAIFLVAAVAIAGLAQYQLAQQIVTIWQLAAYIVAGILFAVMIPSNALPATDRVPLAVAETERRTKTTLFSYHWAALAVVLGVFVYCLWMFWNDHWREFAFYLWVATLVSYVACFSTSQARSQARLTRSTPDVRNAIYWPLFGAIIVAVALVTLYRLEDLPFGVWYDEANFALFAQQILNGQANWPFVTPFSDPALQMYFHAITQLLFGSTATATRMVSAVSGVVSVALIGVFGSTVWNRKFGLLAMVILGTMRWHLDFSRIGMNEMVFVCFELAVAATLALALTSGRPVWFAVAGVFTGLTMHIYLPSIAVTGMVLVTIVYVLIARPRIQPALAGVLLLGFALAYGPLLEAGIQNPSAYSGRAQHVSIFSSANVNPPLAALESNLRAHFLMFNVHGDGNGRHNIPGQPQLDQFSALLFVLGLAWAIAHSRRFLYLGILLWFFAMMLPGLLSLDFEAPQSARAVGAQVPVAVLICIAIYGCMSVIRRTMNARMVSTWTKLAVPALAILISALIAVTNVGAYFDAQANNETVWEAYSTDSTFTGRELAKLPPSEPVYISPDLLGTPSMMYLAPAGSSARAFLPAESLPLVTRTPSVIFTSRLDDTYRSLIHDYYPHAQVLALEGPSRGPDPLVVENRLSTADLTLISGMVLSSSTNRSVHQRVVDEHGRFHTSGIPGDEIWTGGFHVNQFQNAALNFTAPGIITVAIDGHARCSGSGVATCRQTWAAGNHVVTVRIAPKQQPGSSTLRWTWGGAGGAGFFASHLIAHGLVASYFANANWHGTAALARLEPTLSYYYQYLDGLGPPWSARWRGQIHIPRTGKYTFDLLSIDDSSIAIDGTTIVRSNHFVTKSSSVVLRRGWHRFGARLRAVTGGFRIYLSWIPPGSGASLPVAVPPNDFRP